jgi:hypothetical protein
VTFLWKLHSGLSETADWTMAGGKLRVTFRSPRRRVRLSVAGAEVKVDV